MSLTPLTDPFDIRAARDLLSGGSDNDLLIGGAGEDILLGDDALQWVNPGWDFSRSIESIGDGVAYRFHVGQGGTTITAGGTPAEGQDALYGGRGADWLFAGGGDDLLFLWRGIAHESRRWRHGDSTTTPSSAGIWRMAA